MSNRDNENERFLIAFDGTAYYIRSIATVEYRLDRREKVYVCDQPIGHRFATLDEAVEYAKGAGLVPI